MNVRFLIVGIVCFIIGIGTICYAGHLQNYMDDEFDAAINAEDPATFYRHLDNLLDYASKDLEHTINMIEYRLSSDFDYGLDDAKISLTAKYNSGSQYGFEIGLLYIIGIGISAPSTVVMLVSCFSEEESK